MTKIGQSVNFTNKDGKLIVDMNQYDKSLTNLTDNDQFPFPSKSSKNKINDSNSIRSNMEEKRKKVISMKSKQQQNKINQLRIKKQKLMEKQLHGSAYDDEEDGNDDDDNDDNNGDNDNDDNHDIIENNDDNDNDNDNVDGKEEENKEDRDRNIDKLRIILDINDPNNSNNNNCDNNNVSQFEGLILVTNVVCSALRNCRKASNRLVALEIINGFAEYLNDDIRLDRLVPYVRSLIHDDKKKIHEEHCVVVGKAIEVMSNILSRVIHVPSKYTRLFPDYILETLKLLVDNRREEIIRIEIARQLANIALTGKYFIDYRDKDREITLENVDSTQVNIAKNSNNNNNDDDKNKKEEATSSSSVPSASTLTSDLYKLRTKVSQLIDPLFGVDQYPSVQRALLSNCTQLCEFLGAKFTESKLIPGLFTFFNRKEWQLRVSFLDVVVGISFYIGKESLHKVLLPCLEECLNDARPAVVERCLEAFTSLTEMKIFESQLLLSRIQQICPLVVHYSAWVRNSCVNFLLTAANILGDVRAHCRMLPLLEPYLQFPIVFINRQTLTASLKSPLSISTFNLIISNFNKKNKNLDEIIKQKRPLLFQDQPLYDGILSYIRCIKFIDESNFVKYKNNHKDDIMSNLNQNNNDEQKYNGNGYSNGHHHNDTNNNHNHYNKYNDSSSNNNNNTSLQQQDVKPPRLYSIAIEPTVRIYIPNMPPVIQAVTLANQQSIGNDLDDTDSEWKKLNHSIKSITSNGMLSSSSSSSSRRNGRNGRNNNNNNDDNGGGDDNNDNTRSNLSRDRHPRQVDDTKIREALELPPQATLTQDKLKYTQISKCSFYKNHQPPYMTQSVNGDWKPRGRVITQLTEHEDAVNIMRVSRDNLFVATASNDSTVKIWSCDKIHRCASIKSEQTYNHQKGEIISLAILDSSHSIASGSRDGTIHCFRVEYHDNSDSFAGLQYKFTLDPEEGGVVSMEHFNTFTESLIVFGTQAGNIHGWDIRRKKLSFALPMEPAMGAISAMCIGPSIHSVIVGTARGFIVVFDLRFEFPVQMWRHYDASPIVSLTVIDSKTIINHNRLNELTHPCKGPLVLISTQRSNEICAFDLTTGTCRVRFRNSIAKQQQVPVIRTQSQSLEKTNNNNNSNNLLKKGIFGALFSPNSKQSSSASTKMKQHRNTFASSIAGSTGNTQLGLKISQLPSVYPAALGQCPATRPFSLPSFEASTVLTQRKTLFSDRGSPSHHGYSNHHGYANSANDTSRFINDDQFDERKMNHRSKTISSVDMVESPLIKGSGSSHNGGGGGLSSSSSYKSSDKNRMKFSYSSSLKSRGYVYNCGFVPTVLNRALNVNVIGDELEQLCSNFGNEYGGTTGVLISKEQFLISAGRDRVVRYWDLQQPQKSFRISNTSPNTIFTYNAYKDERHKEVVFEELIEFEEEDYANLNEKRDTATISSSTSQLKKNQSHDTKSVHQDIITDLKAIEYPQNMLLTSSRNGVVKVWI